MSERVTRSVSRRHALLGGGVALVLAAALAGLLVVRQGQGSAAVRRDFFSRLSNAGSGSLTVGLPPAAAQRIYGAPGARGRPIVVVDAGHGGRDPGARSPTEASAEADFSLMLARELRDSLVRRGRVRVALTREDNRYLTLEQRAAVARALDAVLFVSLHMDSAANPLARGASVYSLSDVASDAEAARFAAAENRGVQEGTGARDPVAALLSDLAMRTQMSASADLAERLVARAVGRIGLRPQPHRFADFHVLRRAGTPAVLVEAGYISNGDDEELLRQPAYRARLVEVLSGAIETDVAARSRR